MVLRDVSFVPGLYKIFDEILVNASDNKVRDKTMSALDVEVDAEKGWVRVWNNGAGVPVEMHKTEKVYVPELIFGHLLTSSNYDDAEKKVTGGRNGYGAKLANIFSTEFVVETADGKRGRSYKQVFKKNMSVIGAPEIKPIVKKTKKKKKSDEFSDSEDDDGDLLSGSDWTRVSFKPDLAKFGMEKLEDDVVDLMRKRTYDIAGVLGRGCSVSFNGQRVPVRSFSEYVRLYLPSPDTPKASIKVGDRWEVVVAPSDGQFSQVSFVNGICTTKGGTHVNLVVDQIAKALSETLVKKNKGCQVRFGGVGFFFFSSERERKSEKEKKKNRGKKKLTFFSLSLFSLFPPPSSGQALHGQGLPLRVRQRHDREPCLRLPDERNPHPPPELLWLEMRLAGEVYEAGRRRGSRRARAVVRDLQAGPRFEKNRRRQEGEDCGLTETDGRQRRRGQALGGLHLDPDGGRLCQVAGGGRAFGGRPRQVWRVPAARQAAQRQGRVGRGGRRQRRDPEHQADSGLAARQGLRERQGVAVRPPDDHDGPGPRREPHQGELLGSFFFFLRKKKKKKRAHRKEKNFKITTGPDHELLPPLLPLAAQGPGLPARVHHADREGDQGDEGEIVFCLFFLFLEVEVDEKKTSKTHSSLSSFFLYFSFFFKQEFSFYTLPEYEAWREERGGAPGWKVKYYKGERKRKN